MHRFKYLWWKIVAALLCAHFIEMIGRRESTLELWLQSFYYKDVLSGAVVAWLLLEYLEWIGKRLDRRYDWFQASVKRMLLQLSFGIVLCAILAYVLVNLQFAFVLDQHMEQTTWFYYEFPFVVLLIVFFNLIYFARYLFARANRELLELTSRQTSVPRSIVSQRREVLHVKKGNNTIPVSVAQVAYIYKEGDYNFVRTVADEIYRVDQTLEELENQLCERDFFRANRQYIVQLKACISFSPETFGKMRVALNPEPAVPLIISQKRAPAFRKWLDR
ncbi:LytR/AlgR family response regulator transcription factor [Pseudochryseolinea flava]|uniref:HTH LytTR-type domain-containing protein n=1 Tax=Pseudochryseolinea flava TaxID=2059302 RepID=A0A364Y141_9BACT|nr:LytTR family DNA-binding domain-containing protein [Pseudochryseolinea flava]RAW00419.1 hypothetical protein DQQ10_15320 [Pseudochryseolinea flava]